jgi:hypothetical protein
MQVGLLGLILEAWRLKNWVYLFFLFVNSVTILINGYGVNYDRHEAMIDTTKFATLPVKGTGAVKV